MRHLEGSGPSLESPTELVDLIAADRSPPEHRPWVSTDMVMSLDGAYSVDGRSGELSSPADHRLFIAHRSAADAVLVGAATARAERYRHPVVPAEVASMRERRGQAPTPLLVITSVSLDLGADTPLLDGEPPAPIIAHPASSDISRAPEGLELIEAGDTTVDLGRLLSALADRGVRTVACEGGPGLLGQLAEADLIDEYLLTLSPNLVGGDQVGLLGRNATVDAAPFRLHRVLRDGDHLMCSYRPDRGLPEGADDPPRLR